MVNFFWNIPSELVYDVGVFGGFGACVGVRQPAGELEALGRSWRRVSRDFALQCCVDVALPL